MEKDGDDMEKEISATREEWKKAHPKAAGAKDSDEGPFPYRNEVTVRRYGGHVPQHVVVSFSDGSKETVPFPIEERWHRYFFVKPVKVVSAQLDPERSILLDLNKLDDGKTRESDARPAHAGRSRRRTRRERPFPPGDAMSASKTGT